MSLTRSDTTIARRLGRRSLLLGIAAARVVAALPAWARTARPRSVNLFCPETGERFEDIYWADGAYRDDALRRINWLMRDFHVDAVAKIDPRLVDLLHGLTERLGMRHPVSILSGYRTQTTNAALRHEGMPAAPHSQHLVARAADISIDGIGVGRLHGAAAQLNYGGVGRYNGYIHVDTGPVRDWHYFHHHSHRS
jgi:uncharacterized protein YcbK (DUF882 family)